MLTTTTSNVVCKWCLKETHAHCKHVNLFDNVVVLIPNNEFHPSHCFHVHFLSKTASIENQQCWQQQAKSVVCKWCLKETCALQACFCSWWCCWAHCLDEKMPHTPKLLFPSNGDHAIIINNLKNNNKQCCLTQKGHLRQSNDC